MSFFDWIFGPMPEFKHPLDPNEYSRRSMEHERWLVEKAIEMKKLEVEELKLRALERENAKPNP